MRWHWGAIMPRERVSLFARLVGAILMLVALVMLTAIVLHGWQMYRLAQSAQQRSLRDLVHLGATQLTQAADVAAGRAPLGDGLLRHFDQWGGAVIQQRAILAMALRDDRGRVRRVWPPDVDLQPVLAAIPTDREFAGPDELEWSGERTGVCVVACPLGADPGAALPGDLVVVARRPELSAAWSVWTTAFALPLGSVATIGFILGLQWLRRRVREPLRTLVRLKHEQEVDWLARLPTDRNDELGGIARGTKEIIAELCDARARLERLQRSLDSRVAERTREIKAMLKDAQRQVWVDPLTRLGNRRLLDDRLEALFRAQLEAGGELTVVMFDIDHFKQHNDTLGHKAGDELLRFFGQLLLGGLRDTDLGIRYAGDEFLVLLLDASPPDAVSMATRMVRLFSQHSSLFPTEPQTTLSAGVASIRLCGVTHSQELLACADAALYQAKGAGKNRVCTWTPHLRPQLGSAPSGRAE